ncbi:MAG: hypothetical protein KKB59_10310 [Spirochaetes bacterium]|nr:hypothetical protein [Spirochaetota bacterium]
MSAASRSETHPAWRTALMVAVHEFRLNAGRLPTVHEYRAILAGIRA